MDQLGEFSLGVSVAVSPIFESLHASRPCSYEVVVDWSMPPVAEDGVEETCIVVLIYCDFFVFDGDVEVTCFHGCLISFCLASLWCRLAGHVLGRLM